MPSPTPTPLRLFAVGLVATGLIFAGSPASVAGDGLPDGRRVTRYTVQPGDTATGLAVRFHAWTRELLSVNDLGTGDSLSVGQRLAIPVVTAAVPDRPARQVGKDRPAGQGGGDEHRAPSDEHTADVRRVVAATARRHGVDPHLALAIAWQESGWQMDRVSETGALGAMQVMPDTGTWMASYADRPLRLRTLQDNATAGVLLLKVLRGMASSERNVIAAYYQGLGAVREHGLFDDTHGYVANVRALRDRLERGQSPA